MSFKMAMCANSIVKSGFNLLGKNVLKQLMFNASRQLYTPNAMGMSGYLSAREYVKSQFYSVDHLFLDKMRSFVDKNDDSMIFTEDLKTMLHIIENKPEDLDLLYRMLIKFNSQNNLRFGNFIFGTVVMRAFYHLDLPDLAYKAFKDPALENMFDQLMTYQILMDMLYNHGRYADVREIYGIIKDKNVNGVVHPKNPFVIVMAACYKENTKESLDYALGLFQEVQSRGYEFPRRALTFVATLALRQNAPSVAIEIAATAKNVRYIDIRCIKVEAYAALKRFDEIMMHFRTSLQTDMPTVRKIVYFKDTIENVERYIKESGEFDESSELMKMLQQIKFNDYIQPETLDDHLCNPIEQVKYSNTQTVAFNRPDFNRHRTKIIPRQQNYREPNDDTYNTRPGLRDIV